MTVALDVRSRLIGNHTYYVRALGAAEGQRILIMLVKVLGPSLVALIRGDEGKESKPFDLMELDGSSIANALMEFFGRVNAADLKDICKTLGECSEVEQGAQRRPLDLECQELHFAGKQATLLKWLVFALEVNYSDFFGSSADFSEVLGKLGLRSKPVTSSSKSQTDSSGSSGES